jgi:hypothetical protein
MDEIRADFLFARPSLIEGTARILDWAGALNEYNTSETDSDADAKALGADWWLVGQAMWDACDLAYQDTVAKQMKMPLFDGQTK